MKLRDTGICPFPDIESNTRAPRGIFRKRLDFSYIRIAKKYLPNNQLRDWEEKPKIQIPMLKALNDQIKEGKSIPT